MKELETKHFLTEDNQITPLAITVEDIRFNFEEVLQKINNLNERMKTVIKLIDNLQEQIDTIAYGKGIKPKLKGEKNGRKKA